jgi:tripartite-type tricarboxylate transporter receptor subunit TctC
LLFADAIETKMTNVAYRGTGPAMNDLTAGQVDLMCDQIVNVVSHVQAGSIKGYAVTGTDRAPALPELPAAGEAGLPDFSVKIWYGLFAPKGTPKPIIDKLVASLNDALKDPTIKERLAALGAETVSLDRAQPEALRSHLKAEIDKWGPIIKKAGVTGTQ